MNNSQFTSSPEIIRNSEMKDMWCYGRKPEPLTKEQQAAADLRWKEMLAANTRATKIDNNK